MTEVTRCDSLPCVHNGHICSQCATLLADQVKLTHGLGEASTAGRTKSSPSKLYLAHMIFLISGSLLVWIRSESIHHNLRSTFAKPLLIVRFFLRLKELKRKYAKTTKSCAILINPFGETCFRTPCIFGGHRPRCASLQGICFSECVNLR